MTPSEGSPGFHRRLFLGRAPSGRLVQDSGEVLLDTSCKSLKPTKKSVESVVAPAGDAMWLDGKTGKARAEAQLTALQQKVETLLGEKVALREEIALLQGAWRESEETRELEAQRSVTQGDHLEDARDTIQRMAQEAAAKASKAAAEKGHLVRREEEAREELRQCKRELQRQASETQRLRKDTEAIQAALTLAESTSEIAVMQTPSIQENFSR